MRIHRRCGADARRVKEEMSEKIDLSAAQKKLAETLKGIGADLWGKADPGEWAE